MPIRPEGFSTGKPSAPTAGPTIQLANGENMELSWQERSLCAQTDPEAHARNEERLEQRDPELSSGDVRELKGLNPEFDYAYYE